jgi:hypothetical protein
MAMINKKLFHLMLSWLSIVFVFLFLFVLYFNLYTLEEVSGPDIYRRTFFAHNQFQEKGFDANENVGFGSPMGLIGKDRVPGASLVGILAPFIRNTLYISIIIVYILLVFKVRWPFCYCHKTIYLRRHYLLISLTLGSCIFCVWQLLYLRSMLYEPWNNELQMLSNGSVEAIPKPKIEPMLLIGKSNVHDATYRFSS